MKYLILVGALVAVLATPAFAEEPLNPNDPYKTDEAHLSAQSREIEQGIPIQTSPQAGTTNWQWGGGLINGHGYEPYGGPVFRGRHAQERRER